MPVTLSGYYRRWGVFGAGLAASVLPALLLTAAFAHLERWFSTFLAFLVEFLVGPVKYWAPVLLGYPSEYALHPMPGASTWIYLVCLPLTFAHPIKPCFLTGWLTALAFAVWYGWAFLILGAFEY